MRKKFHKKLSELNKDLLQMGSMVEDRIYKAIKALTEQDRELAEQVIANDDQVDDCEEQIKRQCVELLALQQPVASDLRQIAAVSKISTDLERIGDLAQNIARLAQELAGEDLIKPLVDIPKMGKLAREMVHGCLEAFVELDADLAAQVGAKDKQLNEIDDQVIRELLTYMMENTKLVKQGHKLLFISRYLERIGDHAKNVCEKIVYMVNGDRVHY